MEEFPKNIEQKSKEGEQMLPILIIYRDNDLFEKWMPEVVQNLRSFGRKVEIQSFTSTTDKEQIKQWIIDNKENLQGKELLSDGTCKSATWDKRVKQELKEELTFSNLDSLMSEATESALLGVSQKDLSKSLPSDEIRMGVEEGKDITGLENQYLSVESKAIKCLIGNMSEKPKEIVILKHIIAEHTPFKFKFQIEKGGRWLEEEEQDPEKREKIESSYAEFLASTFREGGVPKVSVADLPKDLSAKMIEKIINRESFVIYDRHLLMPHNSSDYTIKGQTEAMAIWGPHKTKSSEIEEIGALRWPLETFYEDVKEKGLIETRSEDFRKAIQGILKTKFDKK